MARLFDSPLFTSDQSIDRVLSAGLPVILVFVDGQTPAALDQEMKRLAKDHAGQLLVVQVPTKDSPETLRRYGTRGFPAVVTVRDGKELSRAEAISPADLTAHASYLLGKGPRPLERSSAATPAGHGPSGNGASSTRSGKAGDAYAQAGSGRPVTVTDASFDQEVMRSAHPVLVDFWAPWCGPCRMVAPILEKLAQEMSGRLKVAKVNVDENPLVAGSQGIQAIPTMLVVKDGRVVDRWSGALPEQALRSRLAKVVKL